MRSLRLNVSQVECLSDSKDQFYKSSVFEMTSKWLQFLLIFLIEQEITKIGARLKRGSVLNLNLKYCLGSTACFSCPLWTSSAGNLSSVMIVRAKLGIQIQEGSFDNDERRARYELQDDF